MTPLPDDSIPAGLCQCGCGSATNYRQKYKRFNRFILGHDMRSKRMIEDAQPFKIEGVYCRLIPLRPPGFYAIVDATDYPLAMQKKWRALKTNREGTFYAVSGKPHVYLHRFLLGIRKEDPIWVDHKNHNPLDNRRGNIRRATASQNAANRLYKKNLDRNVSAYKTRGGTRWRLNVTFSGVTTRKAGFASLEQARIAVMEMRKEMHGEFFCP